MVWLFIMVFVTLSHGCNSQQLSDAQETQETQVASEKNLPRVTVRVADYEEIQAERSKHHGKVIVLDCWSTSCPPCVKEFPGLVNLKKTFGEKIVCLSLSFDYEGFGQPEDTIPTIEQFLNKVGAQKIINFVSREDADVLYKKMDLVSVPAIFIWDTQGNIAKKFDDDMATKELGRPFTYDDVTAVVSGLVQ